MSKEQKAEGPVVSAPLVEPKAAVVPEPTRSYRLKAGARFYNTYEKDETGRPKCYMGGAIVDLTVAQAQAFGDLIEASE